MLRAARSSTGIGNRRINPRRGRSETVEARGAGEPVTLAALFIGLLKVSLCGIGGGGGIVWARRIAVETRRWISDREFADIVSLCQFMPGPNIVGIAVCVGARMRGGAGAIAALCGFLVVPWAVGFSLGVFFLKYAHLTVLRNILSGIAAAVRRTADRH